MNNISNYIQEKLKISSNTKINKIENTEEIKNIIISVLNEKTFIKKEDYNIEFDDENIIVVFGDKIIITGRYIKEIGKFIYKELSKNKIKVNEPVISSSRENNSFNQIIFKVQDE